jgi:non-ribosomal peptide synthetase component F
MTVDPGLAAQVAATCRARSTPFMAHLAVFGAFCRVLGAPDDLVVGALVSGRSTHRLTRLVGCFYNILPIRLSLSGNPTFAELADRTRQTATAALMHQAVPYGRLLRVLRPPGGRFFDVAFQCRNFPPLTAHAGSVSFEVMSIDWGLSQWDLIGEVTPRDTGAELRFAYQCAAEESDRGTEFSAAFTRALKWAASGNAPLSVLVGSR